MPLSNSVKNLFEEAPFNPEREFVETLVRNKGFKLERLVSKGHRTPDGKWYDNEEDEWFVLLSGAATLTFEDPHESMDLAPGDYYLIPAHQKHRVEWTDETKQTVWLALHNR